MRTITAGTAQPGNATGGAGARSPAQLELARAASMAQFAASLLDAHIPRHRRLTQLHLGRIVSNPDAAGAFSDAGIGYNMTYNLVEPGRGNALHAHDAVEIFVALDGAWLLAWRARGERATTLAPLELVVELWRDAAPLGLGGATRVGRVGLHADALLQAPEDATRTLEIASAAGVSPACALEVYLGVPGTPMPRGLLDRADVAQLSSTAVATRRTRRECEFGGRLRSSVMPAHN